MKKHFPLIAGLAVSVLLGSMVGQVTFAEENETQGIVDKVLERHCEVAQEMGEECIENLYKNDHRELKKLADNDEVPFYNLYLFMYQNISEAPKNAALKYLADIEPHYSTRELKKILLEDDMSQLHDLELTPEEVEAELAEIEALETELQAQVDASANSDTGITAEFLGFQAQAYYIDSRRRRLENMGNLGSIQWALNEYGALYEKYEKELTFQRENSKLAYQAYASEIFFDNNLSNSANIDILHDLDIINFLLFGEFIIYPDREGEEVELSSEDVYLPLPQEEEVTLAEEAETDDSEIDPYVCLEDETLREALEDFTEYVEEEAEIIATEPDDEDEEVEEPTEAEEEAALSKEEFDNFVSDIAAAPADWSRGLPCNEIFCITVNLVKGSWGTSSGSNGDFEETENCIECHLDYIAAAVDETLSGGVHPNKVSQNWFEDGTCKDVGDGLNLDFNVYAIPVPIQLDPGDDTDDIASTQVENTVNALLEWSYLNNVNALGQSAAEFEQSAYLNNLQVAGQALTIEETLTDLIKVEESKAEELDQLLVANDIQVKVESSYALYHQMSGEFKTMLSTFQNYSDWLKDTYAVDNAPLSSILNKPYCK